MDFVFVYYLLIFAGILKLDVDAISPLCDTQFPRRLFVLYRSSPHLPTN